MLYHSVIDAEGWSGVAPGQASTCEQEPLAEVVATVGEGAAPSEAEGSKSGAADGEPADESPGPRTGGAKDNRRTATEIAETVLRTERPRRSCRAKALVVQRIIRRAIGWHFNASPLFRRIQI